MTHGGHVAAARLLDAGLAVSMLPTLIPGYGEPWEMGQGTPAPEGIPAPGFVRLQTGD